MGVRIGVPRALMYYEYFPMWKVFFNELGAEVVLSDPTSRKILDDGAESCISDACLPIKIYHGHVMNLINKDLDYIFVPRIRSVRKMEYTCPKLIGLPEMIRFSVSNLPQIIDTEVYLWKSPKRLKEAFINCGNHLCDDNKKILRAMNRALDAYTDYMSQLENGLTPPHILENNKPNYRETDMNIAVMGHIYNLYDNYVNMNLFKKLNNNNIKVITPEMIDKNISDNYSSTLSKKLFWAFARRLMGSAMHFFDDKDIDGIIYIMSFGCGIDSFIADIVERRIKREIKIPFLLMIIDEHTGEAGINTRLEAFIDMIKWRKDDKNIPAFR